MNVRSIKKALRRKKEKTKFKPTDFLSTGIIPLNLACSSHPYRGLVKGHYYLFAGASMSGKTWIARTWLAEAARNPAFDDYLLVYDDPEHGALMDDTKFFGSKMARRVQPLHKLKDGTPRASETLDEFYFALERLLRKGQPVFCILDSHDALNTVADKEKFKEQQVAFEKGKEVKGSYEMHRAKKHSSTLRIIIDLLEKTGSLLVIISQTRDVVGFGFEKDTRSGGHALRFYATLELWNKVIGKITKTVRKKPRKVGSYFEIHVKKNRVSGQDTSVIVPFYTGYGVDDTGACVKYLVDEGHWKKKGGKVHAPEFEATGSIEMLVRLIEGRGAEKDLHIVVQGVWREIEEACRVKRKPRYD